MINIIINHVPTTSKKRTRIPMTPTYITIHSTANPKSTAKNERAWLMNPSNTSSTSYHYAVDDKDTIEVSPPREVSYHAGTQTGNYNSIGIEMCESGDREKVLSNTLELVHHLMKVFQIPKENVVRHYDWSKKNCPRILNTDNKWTKWDEFYNRIGDEHKMEKIEISLNGVKKEVDAINKDGNNYVKLQDLRDDKIIIDYDAVEKIPVIKVK